MQSLQWSCLLLSLVCVAANTNRKIFVSKFGGKSHKTTHDLEQLQHNYREQNLKNLYALPEHTKNQLIKKADHALTNGQWELKLAVDYMRYFRDGNRGFFEGKLHAHNGRIAQLTVGQLLDQEKNHSSVKYMGEIVNGMWMLMEDSTWVYPAHLYIQGSSDHLPDPHREAVDLNAGEDAKFVAWIKLMLGNKFDHVSPVINKRIDYELRRRVFEPYLRHNDWFWQGFSGGHVVNNWNIWVNGNILKAAVLTLKDQQLFNEVANKTFFSTDFFLNVYGEDGGCNEGPAYWRQAGGRLIEYLETVADLYQAKDYFKSINLIKSIGEYAYKLHIDRNWFVNFADAVPVISYPPSILAKYGILFDDDKMKSFSAFMYQFHNTSSFISSSVNDINEFFNFLALQKQIESFKPGVPEYEYYWLPDLEVLTTHSATHATSQMFLGAKFGNNHESHNHNDVGNFVLFQNGNPVLIDVGVGTYTAKTFGSHRYELFYMQSDYHNCPTINGHQQKEGNNYTSKNVTFNVSSDHQNIKFTGDIAHTYPKEAHVKSWVRSIHLSRTTNVLELEDKFHLDKFAKAQQLNFMVMNTMKHEKTAHGLLLHNDKVKVNMEFDTKVFTVKTEDKSLDSDHHLTQVWGESVRRISLVAEKVNALTGTFSVKFSPAK